MMGLIITMLPFLAQADIDQVLTKKEALDLLSHQSIRWQQTKLLDEDAAAKVMMANSAFMPHLQFIARQFIANMNPKKYGINLDTESTQGWVEAGSSAVEGLMYLYDKPAFDRIQAADANIKLSAATREQFQSDLKYLTLVQYISAQKQQRKFEIATENCKRSDEILKFAQAKVNSGAGLKIDLLRAQGLSESDRFKKFEAEAQFKKSLIDLAITLGVERHSFKLEPLKVEELKTPVPEKVSQEDIESRGDVRVAQLTVKAQEKLTDAAKDESKPKVTLFGELGIFGTWPLGVNTTGLNGIGGIQLTIPLYSGGLNDGKASEENVKLMKSETQAQQVALEAKAQAELSLEQMKAARSAIEATERGLEIASEDLRLTKQRFEHGSASGVDITGAVQRLSSASDLRNEATFAFEVSKLTYFKNVGKIEVYVGAQK